MVISWFSAKWKHCDALTDWIPTFILTFQSILFIAWPHSTIVAKMTIRLLKFTEFAENALCIYRNFCLFSNILKILIAIRIITELFITFFHCVVRSFHYSKHPDCKNDVLYFYLTSINSMLLVILGCIYSKKYEFLSVHLNSGCQFFNNDENYVRSLKAKHTVFVGFVFVFSLVKVLFFGYLQLSSQSSPNLPEVWHYIFQINLLMCDFRYIFEFLVLYCVLHVMSEQLLCVTRSIDNKNISRTSSQQLIAEVDKWFVIYKHIRESARHFNDIFGIQVGKIFEFCHSLPILFTKLLLSYTLLDL